MRDLTSRQAAASILAGVLSFGLAAPQVTKTAQMLLDLRTVVRGVVGWVGWFSIVFLAVGILAFVIAIPSYFWEGSRKGRLKHRLFRVLAIQCFVYPVLHVLFNIEFSIRFASVWDLAIGGAGLVLGVLFTVLAVKTRTPGRQAITRVPDAERQAPQARC
jgi:hypothetical protein